MAFMVASATPVFSRSSRAGASPSGARLSATLTMASRSLPGSLGQSNSARVRRPRRRRRAGRAAGCRGALQGDQRHVVFLLPAQAGERRQLSQQLLNQRVAAVGAGQPATAGGQS